MQKTLLTLAISTLALGGGIAVSQAQQSPTGPMMQQDRPGMMMQQRRGAMGQQGSQPDRREHEMMRGEPGMRGRMGPGMMTVRKVMLDPKETGKRTGREIVGKDE